MRIGQYRAFDGLIGDAASAVETSWQGGPLQIDLIGDHCVGPTRHAPQLALNEVPIDLDAENRALAGPASDLDWRISRVDRGEAHGGHHHCPSMTVSSSPRSGMLIPMAPGCSLPNGNVGPQLIRTMRRGPRCRAETAGELAGPEAARGRADAESRRRTQHRTPHPNRGLRCHRSGARPVARRRKSSRAMWIDLAVYGSPVGASLPMFYLTARASERGRSHGEAVAEECVRPVRQRRHRDHLRQC